MSDVIEGLVLLQLHLDNLKAANNFEDYKAAHVAYVENILARATAQGAKSAADDLFFIKSNAFRNKKEDNASE